MELVSTHTDIQPWRVTTIAATGGGTGAKLGTARRRFLSSESGGVR